MVLVQYASLVDEDGSTPFEEEVDVACIRPLPPDVEGNPKGFEFNEVIDAYRKEGWWTGIVKKVLDGARYHVYFDNPPDVLELDDKDLRSHLDWVDGKWFRPKKQQSTPTLFSCGQTVEVILDRDDLCDVWVPAVVITECDNGAFFVRCLSPKDDDDDDDDDDAETIKATVDSRHIRPPPPSLTYKVYHVLQPVDTVHELGWREGIITKAIAGKRYIVQFKHGKEEKEFEDSNLRPHFEWIDGKWAKEEPSLGLASPEPKSPGSKSSIISENNDQSSGKREILLCSTNYEIKGTQQKRKRGIPESSNRDPSEGNDPGCKVTKVYTSAADAPIGVAEDNQPLSTGTDENRLSGAEKIRESSLGASGCGNIIAAEMSIVTLAESSSTIALVLPFAKKSPMWEIIESMEVYRACPQQPHFAFLLNDKKEHREGTALGMMITFADLMVKIGTLEFDEPRDVLNSIMSSLLGFEKNGFDVRAPLTQVEQLYNIKLWVEDRLETSKENEKEIDALDSKSESFNEAMEEVRKKVGELEEELASIKSKKEKVGNEIGNLKLEIEGLSSGVQSHQSRFHDIVNAFRDGNDV